jgi:hypothetical protein
MQIMMKNLDKIPTDVYVPRNDGMEYNASWDFNVVMIPNILENKQERDLSS